MMQNTPEQVASQYLYTSYPGCYFLVQETSPVETEMATLWQSNFVCYIPRHTTFAGAETIPCTVYLYWDEEEQQFLVAHTTGIRKRELALC